MTKKLVSRDKQEEIDKALRERKKAMRRLAKSKLRSATGIWLAEFYFNCCTFSKI